MFVNCVIFFYESNKSGDSYAAKKRSRVEITNAEVLESIGKYRYLGHIKSFLFSRPVKIEKVMRACVFYFYFLYFLQGQIDNFETRINSHFPLFM